MEHDPGGYLKLQVKQFPARSLRETAEGKYWKQFRAPVFAKQVRGQCHVWLCAAICAACCHPCEQVALAIGQQTRLRADACARCNAAHIASLAATRNACSAMHIASLAAPRPLPAPTCPPRLLSSAAQFGPVTHVDFCETYPYHFAVTASTRVRQGPRAHPVRC